MHKGALLFSQRASSWPRRSSGLRGNVTDEPAAGPGCARRVLERRGGSARPSSSAAVGAAGHGLMSR